MRNLPMSAATCEAAACSLSKSEVIVLVEVLVTLTGASPAVAGGGAVASGVCECMDAEANKTSRRDKPVFIVHPAAGIADESRRRGGRCFINSYSRFDAAVQEKRQGRSIGAPGVRNVVRLTPFDFGWNPRQRKR